MEIRIIVTVVELVFAVITLEVVATVKALLTITTAALVVPTRRSASRDLIFHDSTRKGLSPFAIKSCVFVYLYRPVYRNQTPYYVEHDDRCEDKNNNYDNQEVRTREKPAGQKNRYSGSESSGFGSQPIDR